jgi:hypothetical protein
MFLGMPPMSPGLFGQATPFFGHGKIHFGISFITETVKI